MDAIDSIQEAAEKSERNPLETWVAIAVVVLATFMAISAVKGDNIVQAMAQAKSEEVDQWAYFQAKSTKENIAEVASDQAAAAAAAAPNPAAAAAFRGLANKYWAEAKRYSQEKEEIRKQAE